MKKKEYKIIANFIRNDGKFDIPKITRTSVHRNAYGWQWTIFVSMVTCFKKRQIKISSGSHTQKE